MADPSTLSGTPSDGTLSEADAILLSALLDEELDHAEKAQLERRLVNEPDLQKEWEALQAGHVLLQSVDPAQASTKNPPSAAFNHFSEHLQDTVISEIPTATSIKPPRLRQWALVLVGIFIALLILNIVNNNPDSRRRHAAPTWRTEVTEGSVTFTRKNKKSTLTSKMPIRTGDQITLTTGSQLLLTGPDTLRCQFIGPSQLRIKSHGKILLTKGEVLVTASTLKGISALKLETPDGEVIPKSNASKLSFSVVVKKAEPHDSSN